MFTKVQDSDVPQTSPYLVGNEVATDSGPLLSLFALQEIMAKVRQVQTNYLTESKVNDLEIPEVQEVVTGIKALLDEKLYRIIEKPDTYFRYIVMQSNEQFLRVNTYYEKMSEIGDPLMEDDPMAFYTTILQKVRYLREQGSFLLYNIATHDLRGMEVADADIIGIDISNVINHLTAEHRAMIQHIMDGFIIENGNVAMRDVDTYMVAMSEPIYQIHTALQGYIEGVQQREIRQAFEWLGVLARRKRIDLSNDFLTDFRRRDTIWVLSLLLPINPNVIWEVPRCAIANLIMNIALCMPMGDYLLPNPRIASITLTQRITTTGPFSIMAGATPTALQMGDVRKIYLALMFPGQIIIDLRVDPTQRVDPTTRMVAGVVGHLMFTYGPRFTNITAHMADALDRALGDFLLYMYGTRTPIIYGPTGQPLDFHIGRIQYDCNNFRGDPTTGRGYNGWAVQDVEQREPSPYDTVQRQIRYCNIDSREIVDPTTYGINMEYHVYTEMMRMLIAAGKDSEAAYLRQMLPFHMVRFARINSIINEDLLSAFSMPDNIFDTLLPNLINGVMGDNDPVILEVGWMSIWFAFNRSFEPNARSDMLNQVPLIESIYASELSVMKHDMMAMSTLQARFPDSLIGARPSHFWKAVLNASPSAVKDLMNLSSSHSYVNIRDIMRWTRSDAYQNSMKLTLERRAWEIANDFEELMLVDRVYMHRSMVPEPRLDDINLFRRDGFFYTNMMEGMPELERLSVYTHEIARLQANMGQFRSELRRIMDDDGWIQFTMMLRSVRVKFFEQRPPDEILNAVPFEYTVSEKGGLSYATIKYGKEATIYYLIYKVEYSDTPDSLVLLNPMYTMTKVYMTKRIVERVSVNQLLSLVNKRVVAYKKKMRIMDITTALKAGTRLAVPTQ
uniref:VP3 n=1 Tax=Warrego virus TaxID=40062 RepID=U5N4A4_9REOV|nr:VP3 [Warrego virus]